MRKQVSSVLLTIVAVAFFICVDLATAADLTPLKSAEYVLAGRTIPPEQNVVKLHLCSETWKS